MLEFALTRPNLNDAFFALTGRALRDDAPELMFSGFIAALGKDFRLLLRDRVGLVFMTLAPVVVITVAGLSLANLYGVTGGTSVFVLPLVDEDGGRVGHALAERLRDDRAVRVTWSPSAARRAPSCAPSRRPRRWSCLRAPRRR